MKWDIDEAVLLLELYGKLKVADKGTREHLILNFSNLLIKRAIDMGIEVDNKFRNVNGIKMQLQNFTYVITDGKTGLLSASNLFKTVYNIYTNDRVRYNKMLLKAHDSINDNSNCVKAQRYNFVQWLSTKNSSSEKVKNICESIYIVDSLDICPPIFSVNNKKEISNIVNTIKNNNKFRTKNIIRSNGLLSAINRYVAFLTDNTSFKNNNVITSNSDKSPQIPKLNKPINDQSNDLYAFEDKQEINLNEFYHWLVELKHLSSTYAKQYVSYIKTSNQFNITDDSLWKIKNKEKMKKCIQALYNNDDFLEINKCQHNRFSKALNYFYKFTCYNNVDYIQTGSNGFENNSKSVKFNTQETDKSIIFSNSLSDKDLEKQCIVVVSKYFSRGFKINSVIDTKKFRGFYLKEFGIDLPCNDDLVSDMLVRLCIEYDSGRVMSPNMAISEKALTSILNYIEDSFNKGIVAIYFDSIYNLFENDLIDTNTYNSKILKQVLKFYLDGKYCFKRNYISIDSNTQLDISDEIKELLVCRYTPVSIDEILENFQHLTLGKVRQILNMSSFICTNNNYYSHIDCFLFTEEDLVIAENNIKSIMGIQGFVSNKRLYDNFETIFLSKYNIQSPLCLINVLEHYFSSDFDFSKNIISSKGSDMSTSKILFAYCEGKESFTMDGLVSYADEFSVNLQGAYMSEILRGFIRVNETEFFKKEIINFITEQVDEAIEKFCNNGYAVLASIERFSIFPSVILPWNTYLLESYIINYSERFRIMSNSYSITKCIGAVVDKSFNYTDYDNLLADVLLNNNALNINDTEDIIEYLYSSGYLAKRRLKSIDNVIEIAKRKQCRK